MWLARVACSSNLERATLCLFMSVCRSFFCGKKESKKTSF
jgi:hypothetical protein